MSKNKKSRVKRNRIMATVAKNDPTRYRERTVLSEKGTGKKNRPRQKDWSEDVPLLAA